MNFAVEHGGPNVATVEEASTFALGLEMKTQIEKYQPNRVVLFLGGTCTSDGGLGFLKAFGTKFENVSEKNNLLGTNFLGLADAKNYFSEVEFICATDVLNPVVGEFGAQKIFAAQKGATDNQIEQFEKEMEKFADELEKIEGISIRDAKGAGAAGGLGGACLALGAKIVSGFSIFQERIAEEIADSALVVTGEGKMDSQTGFGKVPVQVLELAEAKNIPCVALVGVREDIGELENRFLCVTSIQQGPVSIEDAMKKNRTTNNLKLTAKNILRVFCHEKLNKTKE
jgi:glycerate kinase